MKIRDRREHNDADQYVQRMQASRGEAEEEQLGALGVLRREGKIDTGEAFRQALKDACDIERHQIDRLVTLAGDIVGGFG